MTAAAQNTDLTFLHKITFRHFHDGNDKDHVVRGTAVYATRAALVDLKTGDRLFEAWAFCSPKDNPTRPKGRELALSRLTENIYKHASTPQTAKVVL
jgi:hypothetical protein